MVNQCILNQTRGYWLLLDALVATLKLSIALQDKFMRRMVGQQLVCRDFDLELEILHFRMANHVVLIILDFLAFCREVKYTQAITCCV